MAIHASAARPAARRRRRVAAGLGAALLVGAACSATAGSATAWAVTAVLAVALLAYGALVAAARRHSAREFLRAFAAVQDAAWPPVDLAVAPVRVEAVAAPGSRVPLLDRWAVTRFVWAGLAGCLLDVVVALTDRLLGDPSTAGGRRRVWIARSERLQAYLIGASATATASVVAVGSMAAMTGS